jgi:mycoredoxin
MMEGFSRSEGFICMTALSPAIIVYWRPGCPFCTRLFKALDRAGVEVETVNIWEDQAGAAIVRSVNGGNEIVPTVAMGASSLTNPSVLQIVIEIERASDGTLLNPGHGIDESSRRLTMRRRFGFSTCS